MLQMPWCFKDSSRSSSITIYALLQPPTGMLFSFMFMGRCPDDLYKDGVQRDRFIPFIELLKVVCPCLYTSCPRSVLWSISTAERTTVMVVSRKCRLITILVTSPTLRPSVSFQVVLLSSSFSGLFHSWRGSQMVFYECQRRSGKNSSYSSSWSVFHVYPLLMLRGVCVFNFHDLCGEALGAADYMALCSNFHTLVLNNIPQMKMDDVAECRRFITLVDELYENKVCSCSRMTHSFIGQAHLPS